MGHTQLSYNPHELKRETKRHYISLEEHDIEAMLKDLGAKELRDVFKHLPPEILFSKNPSIGEELSYDALWAHMNHIADKNQQARSFIADALTPTHPPKITKEICQLRGLTTAYTPYQPERSQGTLTTLWIYASTMSKLTGMGAINASLYDRSTCLYEAIQTAMRLRPGKTKALIASSLFPQDLSVLKTLALETATELISVPLNSEGTLDLQALSALVEKEGDSLTALAFPHSNHLGLLEDVDQLTNFCREKGLLSIAVVDPILMGASGLKSPGDFGTHGADMMVAEGQGFAFPALFGGPGLGIFGIRYNAEDRLSIRQTPGRFIGKAIDQDGRPCLAMVLSTREQHIRREKATSNICSNQSFVASLAGAGLLSLGDEGLNLWNQNIQKLMGQLEKGLRDLGLASAYPHSLHFHETCVLLPQGEKVSTLLSRTLQKHNLELGLDVSERDPKHRQVLKIAVHSYQSSDDIVALLKALKSELPSLSPALPTASTSGTLGAHAGKLRGLKHFSDQDILSYYTKLAALNVSPDDHIYPLGSCTMKYNPYINDAAAGLPGFADLHPQSHASLAQGPLEILYETQELFKKITGLAGLTTQPVAGAQGELVGLKLFQAYHRHHAKPGDPERDILLIPKSAHGTNPATATMAGFITKKVNGQDYGIITLGASASGQIDMNELHHVIEKYGKRIAGIMVTNPNTSGLFEQDFHLAAKLVHSVGGLVYMDGANMNAIAGIVDLAALGVDAVHNNLHKTWTIPHGGGGPGDAIVAVSEKLLPFLPGHQVEKQVDGSFIFKRAPLSIGDFHRHHGNFGHKIRCYTYIKRLGEEGVPRMSEVAVLSAQYLYQHLKKLFPTLPADQSVPRMHEFIITLAPEMFAYLEKCGTKKADAIARVGKLFLDFGLHAPTVAFPEQYGLMIEPTESFSKPELDHFLAIMRQIHYILTEHGEVLTTVPHFTPVKKIDEVWANKQLILSSGPYPS
jgi:glycine dehydrogenase